MVEWGSLRATASLDRLTWKELGEIRVVEWCAITGRLVYMAALVDRIKSDYACRLVRQLISFLPKNRPRMRPDFFPSKEEAGLYGKCCCIWLHEDIIAFVYGTFGFFGHWRSEMEKIDGAGDENPWRWSAKEKSVGGASINRWGGVRMNETSERPMY